MHGVNVEGLVPFLPFWCHVIRLGTWHGLLVWGYGAQHMISVFLEPHAGTNVSGESLSCNHLIEAALGFWKIRMNPDFQNQHFWTNVQYVQFSAARQQRWRSIPRILKKAMQQRLEFMQIQWTFCVALLRVKETGKKIIPRPVGCPVAVCPPRCHGCHVRSSIVMGPRLPYFEFHNSWSRGSKGQGQPSSISANDDPFFSFWMKWNQRWTFDDHWCWHFYSPHVDENWDVFYFTPGGPTCNTNTTVFFIAVLFSFWSSDCWIVGPDSPLSRWSRSRCERAAGEGPGEEVDLGDH